jgi:hypothetical protein
MENLNRKREITLKKILKTFLEVFCVKKENKGGKRNHKNFASSICQYNMQWALTHINSPIHTTNLYFLRTLSLISPQISKP